jgi:hypothetical protein
MNCDGAFICLFAVDASPRDVADVRAKTNNEMMKENFEGFTGSF